MPRPQRFFQRLAQKVAIVTGAGSQGAGYGTGKAIAIVFAAEGAKVCLVDQRAERAEATRREIEAAGGSAMIVAADITKAESCAAIVAATLKAYGKIDILVNNVGIGVGGGPLEQLDEATWDRVMDVNLRSALLMTKYSIASLVAARGSIVSIASVAALRAHGGGVAYSASKAAMIAMTRDVAVMYGERGVR